MKSPKQIVAAAALTIVLTSMAFAGDVPCGVTSAQSPSGKHMTTSARPSDSTLSSLTNAVYSYLGYVLLIF